MTEADSNVVDLEKARAEKALAELLEESRRSPPIRNQIDLLGHNLTLMPFAGGYRTSNGAYEIRAGVHFYGLVENESVCLGVLRINYDQWQVLRADMDRMFESTLNVLTSPCLDK